MSEYYYELKIKPNSHYEVFLDLLVKLTDEAVEELNGTLISRSEFDLENIAYGIEQFAKSLGVECEISTTKQKNEDWIQKYKEAVKPIVVGKFYVHPSWVEDKEDKINVLIDPALAFGSGHHETTNSCLDAISRYVNEGDELLDVGTGSGILSIAASKMGAIVDICDTDSLAVENAEENFKTNNANLNRAWSGSATFAKKEYDVVIANIVADVLVMISNDLKKCLKEGSTLILSGILDKHLDRVLKKFNTLEKIEVIEKNEWVTLILKNK